MILNRTLNAAERLASQKTLRNYWAAFALGQACCGEATIQLMALAINIPDRVVAAMGAMNYAGFLALPLGFVLGGKLGAGKSMQLENYLAALAALAWPAVAMADIADPGGIRGGGLEAGGIERLLRRHHRPVRRTRHGCQRGAPAVLPGRGGLPFGGVWLEPVAHEHL